MDIGISIVKAFRTLMLMLCNLVYSMIIFFFNIFEKIGTANVVSDTYIMEVYKRVGLILGLFMLFRITFSAIQYVINPDLLMDKKTGVGNIVKKAFLVVVLLGTTPYLFQLAFKVQNLIIEEQVISKVLVGGTVENDDFGVELVNYTFFEFYTENKASSKKCGELVNMPNYVKKYGNLDMAENCIDLYDDSNEVWAINFDYHGLLPLIVGCLILWMIVVYTLQVAVRAFQLAYLQLIAPVPIMLYLDPKKDDQLQKWFKQCTTTYLDLFIRVGIIYFVVYVIKLIMSDGFFNTVDVSGGFFSEFYVSIVMILALLVFAKKVPDLFKELFPMGGGSAKFDFGLNPKKSLNNTLAAGLIGGAVGGVGAMASNAVHGYMKMNKAWNKNSVDSRLTKEQRSTMDKKDIATYNSKRRAQMASRFGAVAGAAGKTALSMAGGALGGAAAGLKTKDISKASDAIKTANKNRENRELMADAGYHWYNPLPTMRDKVLEFSGESGDTFKNRDKAIRDIAKRESDLKAGKKLYYAYGDPKSNDPKDQNDRKLNVDKAFRNDNYKVSYRELSDAKGAAKTAEITLSNAQARLNAAYTYTGSDKETVIAEAQEAYNAAYGEAKATQGRLELAKAKHDNNKKIYVDDAKVEDLFKLYSDLRPALEETPNASAKPQQKKPNEPVSNDSEREDLLKQIIEQEDKVSKAYSDSAKKTGEKPFSEEAREAQKEYVEEEKKLDELNERKAELGQTKGTGASFMDVSNGADNDEMSIISRMSVRELSKYAKSLEDERSKLEREYMKLENDKNAERPIDTAEFSRLKNQIQELNKKIGRVYTEANKKSLNQ